MEILQENHYRLIIYPVVIPVHIVASIMMKLIMMVIGLKYMILVMVVEVKHELFQIQHHQFHLVCGLEVKHLHVQLNLLFQI